MLLWEVLGVKEVLLLLVKEKDKPDTSTPDLVLLASRQ